VKAKDYFELEAGRIVLYIFVLFFLVKFLEQAGFIPPDYINVYWGVAAIIAVAQLATLIMAWLYFSSRKHR
jgi:hypothetical protein